MRRTSSALVSARPRPRNWPSTSRKCCSFSPSSIERPLRRRLVAAARHDHRLGGPRQAGDLRLSLALGARRIRVALRLQRETLPLGLGQRLDAPPLCLGRFAHGGRELLLAAGDLGLLNLDLLLLLDALD